MQKNWLNQSIPNPNKGLTIAAAVTTDITDTPTAISPNLKQPLSWALVWAMLYLGACTWANAQITQVNSPYSRLGTGVVYPSQFAANRALGGVFAAYQSTSNINVDNPASYPNLKLTTFEMAAQGNGLWLAEGNNRSKSSTGSLSYLAFCFPATNFWGTSVGLLPYSSRSYDIERIIATGQPDIDTIAYRFEGKGQLYRIFWGNGFKYKGIAAGFNASYVFGTESRQYRSWFPTLPDSYGSFLSTDFAPKGLLLDFGLQYTRKIAGNVQWTGGLTGSPGMTLGGKREQTKGRELYYSGKPYTITDSTKTSIANAKMKMPPKVAVGIQFNNPGKWLAVADIAYENWNAFRFENQPDSSLTNNMRFAVGFAFTPDSRSFNKFWQAAEYRFGFNYHTGRWKYNGQQLPTWSATLGAGFPLRRIGTRVNFALEVGQTGSLSSNIIRETFVIGTVGFTLNERWFIKPKFD